MRNTTANNIVEFFTLFNTKNKIFIVLIAKKTAHAYFERLYFSKFFGGKITPLWTAIIHSFEK